MRIVVDTNIIRKEGFGTSRLFRFLIGATQVSEDTVDIPEVVVLEAVAGFEEELQKRKTTLNKEFSVLQNILGKPPLPLLIELEVTKEVKLFRERLERFGSILDINEVPHEGLIKRAINRKKPFDNNGSGYRDSLIWEAVVELASRTSENIVLLSNDKAFKDSDEEHLAKELKDEVSHLGLFHDDKVVLVRSVEKFLDRFVRPRLAEALLGDPAESLGCLGIDPQETLALAIQEEHLGKEWDGEELGLPLKYETLHLSMVEGVSDLEGIDCREVTTGEYLLKIGATLECQFDAFVHKSEVFGLDDFSLYEFDWNNHYARGGISCLLRCEMDITVDIPSEADPEIAVLSLRPILTNQ